VLRYRYPKCKPFNYCKFVKYKRTFYYVDFVSNFFTVFTVQVSKPSVATKLKKIVRRKNDSRCLCHCHFQMFFFFL
jgi:hypothetical protein